MTNKPDGGTIAALSGRHGEEEIALRLHGLGYSLADRDSHLDARRLCALGKDWWRQAPPGRVYYRQLKAYENLFGVSFKADFLVYDGETARKCLIEVKKQVSPGSVDEKLVFWYQSLDRLSIPTILVVTGDGIRAGCEEWLFSQTGRPMVVTTLRDFKRVIDNHLT